VGLAAARAPSHAWTRIVDSLRISNRSSLARAWLLETALRRTAFGTIRESRARKEGGGLSENLVNYTCGLVFLTVSMSLAVAAAVGCSPGQAAPSSDDSNGSNAAPVTQAPAASTAPPAATATAPPPPPAPVPPTATGPAGTGLATGLPCDVQGVIENRCLACHNDPPANGAPTPLTSFAELAAPSAMSPTRTRAQLALLLMQEQAMPPYPAVRPDADEIAAFANWVNAGAPQNPLACTTPPPATLPPSTLPPTTLPPIGSVGSACLSGTFWTQGNTASELMHPGQACNNCHQLTSGPNLRVGGTVYRGPNEPDDCNGASPSPQLTVVVQDSQGQVLQLPVNASGNFMATNRMRPPLRASVTDGFRTRMMNGTVNSGDCNGCHTVTGANGAPGRILAP
jgi:hypothetical protein